MQKLPAETMQVIEDSYTVCRNAALATMGITLDFDEKSILKIDELLTKGWPDGKVNEKTIQVWGCFLGEAMKRTLKGRWVQTDQGLGVAVGNHISHPLGKIERRFSCGENESVTHFYKSFKFMVIG